MAALALLHESELARTDPDPQFLHRPIERSFFLASRIGEMELPEPTHANPEDADASERGLLPWTTVRDALGDLPAVVPATETLGGKPAAQDPKRKLSGYALLMRSANEFPFNHLTRSYSERIIDIVRQMQPGETWDSASERMQKRYEKLIAKRMKTAPTKAGQRKRIKDALIKEGLINPVFYRRYYWSAYTRLAWDRPALTITANCNFLGSGRFTHPGRAPRHNHAGSGAVAIVRRSLPLHNVRERRRRYVHNRHGDGHDWRGCAAASGRNLRAGVSPARSGFASTKKPAGRSPTVRRKRA